MAASPAVYHDDYTVLSPAAAVLNGDGLTLAVWNSTPRKSEWFGGEGTLHSGLLAGFHLALAAWFSIVGVGILSARLFCWVCGLLILWCVCRIGSRRAGPWVGLGSAILVGLEGAFWFAARTVRPETWTVLMYLAAVVVLDRQASRARAVLAGMLTGLALTGHPIGAILVPFVGLALWTSVPPEQRWRWIAAFVIPSIVVVAVYAMFLWVNLDDLMRNLAVHAEHVSPRNRTVWDVLSREWGRYQLGYGNSYASWAVRLRLLAVAAGGIGCTVSAVSWLRGTADDRDRFLLLAGVSGLSATLGMFVLARDVNFLYLVNVFPLLHLTGVTGLAVVLSRALRQRSDSPDARRPRWIAGLAIGIPLILFAVWGVRSYVRDARTFAATGAVRYDDVERRIASSISEDSLVIGMESAWLAAERRGAEFEYARLLAQYAPDYERPPVVATFVDHSHVETYALDVQLFRALGTRGIDTYYVLDMWDWGWNAYAPHGRYANAFLELRRTLDEHFELEWQVFDGVRGSVALYRFSSSPEAARPIVVFDEREYRPAAAIHDDVTPRDDAVAIPLDAERRTVDLATVDCVPGQHYLIRVDVRVERGGPVQLAVNGNPDGKWFDAVIAVPHEFVVRADTPTMTVSVSIPGEPSLAAVERVSVTPLVPRGE